MKKYKTKFDMSFPLNDTDVFCELDKVKNKKIVQTRPKGDGSPPETVPVIHLKKGTIVEVEKWNYGFYRVYYGNTIMKTHLYDFIERNLEDISTIKLMK
jgi:hypothetical protein